MLLRLSLGREDAATAVEAAVAAAIGEGNRTADLLPPGGETRDVRRVSTREMTEAIVARIAIAEVARETAATPS